MWLFYNNQRRNSDIPYVIWSEVNKIQQEGGMLWGYALKNLWKFVPWLHVSRDKHSIYTPDES